MTDPCDTRQRILNTAAEQYAEYGFEGKSLRTLTEAAGVNLAAVNYYFGSKQGLLVSMVRESMMPMNEGRSKRLNELEAEFGTQPIPDNRIADAYLRPLFDLAGEGLEEQIRFLRMVGRVMTEREEFWNELSTDGSHMAVIDRFINALARTLPQLPLEEVKWRFFFTVSTLIGSFVKCRHSSVNCGCSLAQGSLEEMLERMIRFVSHGCLAPAN